MRELDELPEGDEMFVFGDVKLRPSIARKFTRKVPLGIYLHLYNFKVDQASNIPLLEVSYRIRNGNGQLVRDVTDRGGESIQFLSEERVVLDQEAGLERPGARNLSGPGSRRGIPPVTSGCSWRTAFESWGTDPPFSRWSNGSSAVGNRRSGRQS